MKNKTQSIALDLESLLVTVSTSMTLVEIENSLLKSNLSLRFVPTTGPHNPSLKKILSEVIPNLYALRYGEIDDICLSVTVQTPAGMMHTKSVPRSATGPDLKKIFIGSHSKYGNIIQATLRVVPLPEKKKKFTLKFLEADHKKGFLRDLWSHGFRPLRIENSKNGLGLKIELEGLAEIVDAEFRVAKKLALHYGADIS